MIESLETLTLPFVRSALIAGLLISGMCSYLGVFVVLRRIVFVGIALAQLAAAGVALSFFLPLPPELLALLLTLGGALVLSTQLSGRRIPREAGIGLAYASAAALSVLIVAKSAQGEAHVLGLLFGNILTLTDGAIAMLALATAVVIVIHVLFTKEFLFCSFDPETARSAGYRVGFWNGLFDLTLAGAIAIAIHAAGALLVFSFLVQPAMVGLFLARQMRGVVILAVISGVSAGVIGLVISILADLPTGPTVVALSSVFVLLAALLRKLGVRF
jgi:zinc transport system permease protein